MILPLLLAGALYQDKAYQDVGALDRAVAAFTSHAVGEAGGARAAVDARLRLAACPTVALSWRSEAHDAVVIACSGPDWRLYVPVVRAAGAAPQAAGAATVATAPAGPAVIKRGDPVLVEAGADGFSITREGVAQGDAAAGGRFLVKVADAKAPLQAVATEDGRAVLPGWNR